MRFTLARRPKGKFNCYEARGIVSALLTFRNGYRAKPGIFLNGKYLAFACMEKGRLRECTEDPGYVLFHCPHYQEAELSGSAKSLGCGLFLFPRTEPGAVRLASGTDGYESSIELGFQIRWDVDTQCFESKELQFLDALAIVDTRSLSEWGRAYAPPLI